MLDLPDGHAEMFHGRASGIGWFVNLGLGLVEH